MQLKAIDTKGLFFPPGEVVADRFRLEERIGEGPFGQIYRAQDTLIDAEVALKVFDPAVLKSPIDEERFIKATRSARALTQRNVVRLHDSGVHKNHPWVSMQYLEGLDLRRVARLRHEKGDTFSLEELEPIIAQITLALQHIGRDFPHCNLKPENILFLPSLLKVTDSYLFAALPADVFAERGSDNFFIAPELRSPGAGAGPRCDVYSVGALIGYMLFGEDYTPGSKADAPEPLGNVDALCQRAMALDPAARYESVEALNEDFTSIVDTGRMLARSAATRPPMAPSLEGEHAISAPADFPAPSMEPPTPPPATPKPAEVIDPLDIQTPPDIGMPTEDDLATTEYRRETHGPELGDLLPTNEVDRSLFPKASAPKVDKPASPKPEEKRPKTPEKSKPVDEEIASEKTPQQAPKQLPKREKTDPAASIVIALVVIGLLAVVIGSFARKGDESSDREVVQVDAEAEEALAMTADPPAEEASSGTVEEEAEAEQPASESDSQELAQDEDSPAETDSLAEELEADKEEAAASEVALASAEDNVPAALGAAGRPDGGSSGAIQAPAPTPAAPTPRPEAPAPTPAPAAPAPTPAPAPAAPAPAPTPTPQPAQAAAQGTNCPSGMVLVKAGGSNVCVDVYEYPGSGRAPSINTSWFEARRSCQQQDKRLCTLSEWRAACGTYYPYGRNFDPDRCNTADADGFERSLQASGAASQCRSPSGAYDMSGNVFEWVEEQRVAGGSYNSEGDQASCRYSSPKAPASTSPDIGFRCCATPE